MAGAIDNFLKVSLAVSLLGAAASVGYYYTTYLPARDAQLDRDRKFEAARADLARQADEVRRSAEKRDGEQRQAADREAIQSRYRQCVASAENWYSSTWTAECRKATDNSRKQRTDCLSKSDKSSCDILYPIIEFSSDCKLNGGTGASLNKQLEQSRERCLQESRIGLQ